MEQKNTCALVVPPQRLAKYKEELDKAGFTYTVNHLSGRISSVEVDMGGKKLGDVEAVIKRVVAHFYIFDRHKN